MFDISLPVRELSGREEVVAKPGTKRKRSADDETNEGRVLQRTSFASLPTILIRMVIMV